MRDFALRRGSGLYTVRPRIEWYGFDPIHIRRRHWSPAWDEILSPWNAATSDRILHAAACPRRSYLRSLSRCYEQFLESSSAPRSRVDDCATARRSQSIQRSRNQLRK